MSNPITIDDLRASGLYVERRRVRQGDCVGPTIHVLQGAGPLDRGSRKLLRSAGFQWNQSRRWWQR
jgi:hypothetical protein